MITLSLGVSHTPWVPERVESMRRLRDSLGELEPYVRYRYREFVESMRRLRDSLGELEPYVRYRYREFVERCPNHMWSEQMWTWAKDNDVTHHVFLQDDVIVAPNFFRALRAMLEAIPDQVIGLEAVHPAGMTLARAGERWYTTAEGLIGVGYVFPHGHLHDFIRWRNRGGLKKGAVHAITEDTLIDVWAMVAGHRIWHPVPTLIDHDITLASTYGNDQHANRRPSVTWRDGDVCGWTGDDLERPEFWTCTDTPPPHLGRFYRASHHLAMTWSTEFTVHDGQRLERDECPARFARFFAQ